MRGGGQDEERLQGPSQVHHASELQRTLEFFSFHCLMLLYSHYHERGIAVNVYGSSVA